MLGFGDRLAQAMQQRLPLCVGVDPHPELLNAWGLTDDIAGLRTFSVRTAEALGPIVAALKPQSAFFERHGSRGIAVLEETIAASRAAGALVIVDAKRGDIGSTAQAYADAYLCPESALFADALTVSPYLGFGSIEPFVAAATAVGSGLFVLARTSNPEGAEVQFARLDDGRTVAQAIIDQAAACNAQLIEAGAGVGSIGVVVGATMTPGEVRLDRLDGPILAPGLGAQGGTASDLAAVFGDARLVLASTSRDVLRAGPDAGDLTARAKAVADDLRFSIN